MSTDYEVMLDTKAWGAQANAEIAEALALQEALKDTIVDKNATIIGLNEEKLALEARIRELEAQTPPPTPTMPFTLPAGWALDKYDLFQGTSIDKTKWNVRTGGLGAPRQEYNDPAALVMRNPGLRIVTERMAMPGGKTWRSGYIDSAGFMTFGMNSLIVVRARFDDLYNNASGLWPCPLWLRGDWPGEIDSAEMYGWPFLNPARTNTTENNNMRGNFSGTVHEDTNGQLQKQVRQPANTSGGLIKAGTWYEFGISITDADGIALLFNNGSGLKPLPDAYSRANPMSWSYLDSVGIPKSAFQGNGHARIQTQVGDSYWGPPSATTKSPFNMDIDYFYIAKKA